ncbi:hypothetical protein AVEN_200004-1 [Araneus ventricosus]|uniref:Integrase catalytic domain-containing protein n=1 Tax=Araneus ventricosus TaxID=182803 RepID=A0A4Y2BWA6_ARAVE|nr:hypothetical protein AVEN_200004-1 [Araneus ventricosus]
MPWLYQLSPPCLWSMHFFRFLVPWGFRKKIRQDQGTSFMSELTTEVIERFGVRVLYSFTYHPQSNPVERFHRTLGQIFSVLCSEEGPDSEKHVHAVLFARKTVTHESTRFRPAELVHERNLRTRVNLLYEIWLQPEEEQTPVTEYVFTLLNRLKRFQDLAVKEMEKSQQRNKTWYDKTAVKREFEEGDLVLIFSNCRANKLSPRWTVPGTILKKLSETNYVVSVPHRKDKSQVYHVNMLKPNYKRPEQINYLSLEAEEGIGVNELEIPHIEPTPNVLDLLEIISEPTGSTLTEDQCQ